MTTKRAKPSTVNEFLKKAQKDPKLSARVLKAIERGGRVTADEVLEIAQEFGYSFTKNEFESEVRRDIDARIAAGDEELAGLAAARRRRRRPRPPESTCARGCLSYTISWHPSTR